VADEVLECQQNFRAHDTMLKKHDEEMAEMRVVVTQLPVQMGNLTKQIEELCRAIREQNTAFVSKDFYEARKQDVDRHLVSLDKEVTELWVTHNAKIAAAEAKSTAYKEDSDKKIEALQNRLYLAAGTGMAVMLWAFFSNHFFKAH
jgi:chromosome segregation ATPase